MSRLSDSGVLVLSYQTLWDSRDPLRADDIDVEVVLSRYLQRQIGEHSAFVKDLTALIRKHVALKHIIDFEKSLRNVDPGSGYSIDPVTGRVRDTDIILHPSEHRKWNCIHINLVHFRVISDLISDLLQHCSRTEIYKLALVFY